MKKRILIIGACGQIGSELTARLRKLYGTEKVIASDIRESTSDMLLNGPFEVLDAMNASALEDIVAHYEITDVYLMAAMLSATAEKFPMKAWALNMNALFNVLNLAKDQKIERIFWPSSIAVFGPSTPKTLTPQTTIMEPTTVYGISKQTGERWCAYYHQKYNVDVRSIRYPGLISYKTLPGGGTTDYAIDIFYKALKHNSYTCFLSADTVLPMMFMEDAIAGTIKLMEAPEKSIHIRSSYNLAGVSFSPKQLAASIQQHIPSFKISYAPDFRQAIADSWPQSIDDTKAQTDWAWQSHYTLDEITAIMLKHLKPI